MVTVKQVLAKKGHDYFSVKPSTLVYDALQKMAEKDIGALMVIENDKLLGIFSERDYARKVILHGKSSRETQVGEFMTSKIYFVSSSQSIYDCMALMTNYHIRHLPVLDQNEIAGIISIGDIVNAVIQEQKTTIKDLENYILGGGYGANH
jgi:signal-transduction protein with cAMP-binding, CBS, and nucleotidyltransferase domain